MSAIGIIEHGAPVYRLRELPRPPAALPGTVAPRLPPPEHAPLLTKAARLRRELLNWRRAGYPLTPREERRRRDALCAACEYFNRGGNLGLGECLAPGCGCTRAKTWLATSRCPLPEPKWRAVAPSPR